MCKKSGGRPLTWPQMEHAIKRNFGGLKSDKLDPFEEFRKRLNMAEEEPIPDDYHDYEEVYYYKLIIIMANSMWMCNLMIYYVDQIDHQPQLLPIWSHQN